MKTKEITNIIVSQNKKLHLNLADGTTMTINKLFFRCWGKKLPSKIDYFINRFYFNLAYNIEVLTYNGVNYLIYSAFWSIITLWFTKLFLRKRFKSIRFDSIIIKEVDNEKDVKIRT